MIIRNKHNFSVEKLEGVNNFLMNSWFSEIYGKNEIIKKEGLSLANLKKGKIDNNILFMEDLVRAMKKGMNEKDFKDAVFEVTFIDNDSRYENIGILAVKFVLKDGVLMKFIGDVENIPFKRI